jgi:hypothetical protein
MNPPRRQTLEQWLDSLDAYLMATRDESGLQPRFLCRDARHGPIELTTRQIAASIHDARFGDHCAGTGRVIFLTLPFCPICEPGAALQPCCIHINQVGGALVRAAEIQAQISAEMILDLVKRYGHCERHTPKGYRGGCVCCDNERLRNLIVELEKGLCSPERLACDQEVTGGFSSSLDVTVTAEEIVQRAIAIIRRYDAACKL